jgi:hypothetical protein
MRQKIQPKEEISLGHLSVHKNSHKTFLENGCFIRLCVANFVTSHLAINAVERSGKQLISRSNLCRCFVLACRRS